MEHTEIIAAFAAKEVLHEAGTTAAEGLLILKHEKIAGSALIGFIGSLCAAMPAEKWAAMLKAAAEPCGNAGCTCEILGGEFFKVADKMRARVLSSLPPEPAPTPHRTAAGHPIH